MLNGEKMELPEELNRLTGEVVDAAFKVHRELGPGLLENIYEICMGEELEQKGLSFERQKEVPIVYCDKKIDAAYRLDLLVDGKVLVEIKAVDHLLPVHKAQVITYLKLTGVRAGLLINFNVTMIKDGIQRVVLSEI
jgi:GxxExxY protein